jgi:hypothetical protein
MSHHRRLVQVQVQMTVAGVAEEGLMLWGIMQTSCWQYAAAEPQPADTQQGCTADPLSKSSKLLGSSATAAAVPS